MPAARTGLARALSKLGVCSRSSARRLILDGHVHVNGLLQRNPEFPTLPGHDLITVHGKPALPAPPTYIALNKPRGLVTTACDEQGRDTVFKCLANASLPHVGPVGRLDQASEGLLLFTNDTAWAASLTDPASHVPKTYRIQIDRIATTDLLEGLVQGRAVDGECLRVMAARLLQAGTRNSWIEVVLDEGRNRHLRRLLQALETSVLRLIRIRIGPLELGPLPKGAWRHLDPVEVQALSAR